VVELVAGYGRLQGVAFRQAINVLRAAPHDAIAPRELDPSCVMVNATRAAAHAR
jgi:hypothetical protein